MAIKPFDYEYKNTGIKDVQDTSTTIKPFNYESVAPSVSPAVTPPLTQAKPAFKTFKDLTTKEKIGYTFGNAFTNIYEGLQSNFGSTVDSTVALKDVVKGVVLPDSTASQELANNTKADDVLNEYADIFKTGAEVTGQERAQLKESLGLNPQDSLSDQVLQGVGQVMGFIGGGFALKGASALLKLGKYAAPIVKSGNVILESGMEAKSVYDEVKAQGKSDQEAFDAYKHTLATNALLIGITNKVGGIFDETTYKGFKRFMKVSLSGLVEGGQEALQTIESNYTTGKPLTQGVKESFLIGTILGVPTAFVFDQPTKDGKIVEKDKEAIQEAIDNSEATPEQKDVATKILEGTATEEETTTAFVESLSNPENGIPLNDEARSAIAEDVTQMVSQGVSVGDIVISLQQEGIKQSDAESIVAEAVATPQETIVEPIEEVKVEQKPLDTKNMPESRKMAMDEVNYYLNASEAGRRVFIPERDSYDYKVQAVPSTFPQWVPENMRSRKVFDQVLPFWNNQERPSNKIPRVQKLYDLFQEHVNKQEEVYRKKIDEEMTQKTNLNEPEFKVKEGKQSTFSEEIKVLEDFKRRYKVEFPVVIVDKIIQGQKTKLNPKGDGKAEGVTDGNTIALAFDAVVNTGKHELIHLTLAHLDQIPALSKFSREDILKAQAEKMGVKFTTQTDKDVEEQLALDFEAYQNKDYKPKNSLLSRFFQVIDNMLKNFRETIVKSNGDVIRAYYDAVLYGEAKGKQTVALQTESSISKYLIDNVIDYTPMYQTRRVLSLSNGITSIDFKSKKPSIKAVTGLDQVRINYFASHMDQEDAKVLNDYVMKYDENLQIPPRKDEQISKEEAKAIEYFTEGLRLENIKPEQMASISVAILEQYYATTPKVTIWNEQPKFKEMVDKTVDVYKESDKLTTKILKDLEGKTTVSKQYILDATNRGDIKQVEKDLIRSIVSTEGGKVNVKDFAKKVKAELLPLSTQQIINAKYEFVNLPDELRGNVKDYKEKIYESPVQTSAGSIHFPKYAESSRRAGTDSTDKYFGHTRIEDMADKKLRRVIEVQSDLYQKGRIEQEGRQAKEILFNPTYMPDNRKNFNNPAAFDMIVSEAQRRMKDVTKLEQYNDPTAHFRMIREEVQQATIDGKTSLQFPTGETAMKIEGLGSNNAWMPIENGRTTNTSLTPQELKIGKEINNGESDWIITDVLGDGKFKAIPKRQFEQWPYKTWDEVPQNTREQMSISPVNETFDISGKVDTNNPIYKFYEKEVGKYLKNNYKAETVTDDKGVTWYEVKLKDEYKGSVVAFKEKVSRVDNEEYVKKMYPKYYAMVRSKLPVQKASRAFDRAKSRLQEQFQFDVNYTPVRIVDEMAKAMEVVKQDKEYAKNVAIGVAEAPLDVTDTAISLALAETAREEGNYELQAQIEKERSLRQTRRGQEIVMERGRVDENSPSFFIKQVLDRRKELIAQKYKPFLKKAKPFMEVLDENIAKKMKKSKKIKSELEIKVADLDSFLNEIAC